MAMVKLSGAARSLAAASIAASLACALPHPARADYPYHVITVVVPFAVGGATDILGRLISAGLSARLGQTVVVENKPGTGAVIGTGYVARAKADGYTLLFASTAATETPAMFTHLPYDPLKDIRPVALFAEAPFLVAVSTAKVKAASLKEFIDLLRQNPGRFNAASGGSGSTLSVDLLLLKYNLTATIVSYPSAGEAVTALASGEADFAILDAAPLGPHIASGRIRALAVAADQRLSVLPDVPTAAESGVPGYEDKAAAGLYVRADTPPAIVDRLNTEINAIVAAPDMVERLRKLGWSPLHMSVAQSDAEYRSGIAMWKDIVARAHIPPLD